MNEDEQIHKIRLISVWYEKELTGSEFIIQCLVLASIL